MNETQSYLVDSGIRILVAACGCGGRRWSRMRIAHTARCILTHLDKYDKVLPLRAPRPSWLPVLLPKYDQGESSGLGISCPECVYADSALRFRGVDYMGKENRLDK